MTETKAAAAARPAAEDAAADAEERRLRDLLRQKKNEKEEDSKRSGGGSSRSSSHSDDTPRRRPPPRRDSIPPPNNSRRRGSNDDRGGDFRGGDFRGPPFRGRGGPPPPFGGRGRGGMWERDMGRGGGFPPPFHRGGGPPMMMMNHDAAGPPFRDGGGGPMMMMRGRGGPPRPPPPGWRPRYMDDWDRSSRSPSRRHHRRKHGGRKKNKRKHKRRSRSYSTDSSDDDGSVNEMSSEEEETKQDAGEEKNGASPIKKEAGPSPTTAAATTASPKNGARHQKKKHKERSHKRQRRSHRPRSPSRSEDDLSTSSSSSSSRSYYSSDDGSRSSRSSSRSYYSSDDSRSSRSHSSGSSSRDSRRKKKRSSPQKKVLGESDSGFSKDQRTVLVSQLVMRATERDIKRYFSKKVGLHVREVILLKDKRTGNHKGIAYMELATIGDVANALAVHGVPPDFQRFPLMIKASEAEKNYVAPSSSSIVTASMIQKNIAESLPASAMAGLATRTNQKKLPPLRNPETGKLIESQSVYIGNLDPSVTQDHLFAIFSQLGTLEKVSLQLEPSTGMSRGYAFLTFRDPKESYLAIQCMAHQVLAGRGLKTGWATQSISSAGGNVEILTSTELPDDAAERTQKAMTMLGQLMGTTAAVLQTGSVAEQALDAAMAGATANVLEGSIGGSAVPTVAQARASLVAQQQQSAMMAATAPSFVATGAAVPPPPPPPTQHVLVHNMFDKDQETEPGWPQEIKEEFIDECSKFGKITKAVVMSKEVGGKIYASFETEEGAKECVKNLEGRWFDKRQLRVLYVQESDIPAEG